MLSNAIGKVISDKIGLIRGPSLRAKSVRSAMVLGIGTVIERGARFVRNMILARILAPGEFGLMAIIMVAAMAFEAFAEVGVRQSVIQNKRGADPEYLNVAWWMQAVRGLGLFVIATLAAPYISSFYGKPELLKLLRVAFLAVLFRGLISPRAHVLHKEFKFGRAVFLTQGSGIIGTVTTIGLAFMIRNVWALVIGFVAEAGILCLLSYLLVPFLPRFRIERKCLGELMKFARGMFGLPFLTFISLQTPILFLAKLVADEQLGMYYLALALAYLAVDLFSRTVGPILLPAFAERQDNKRALCAIALMLAKTIASIGLPLVVFMNMCARSILSVVYGPAYGEVAIPFGLLSFYMLFRVQSVVLASMYMAVGKPQLHRRSIILLSLLIISLIYPGIKLFGLVGSAAVVLSANVVALFAQVVWMRRPIGLSLKDYVHRWLLGLCLTPIVFVPSMLLAVFKVESTVLNLFVGSFSFLVACIIFLASSISWKRVIFTKVE